MIGKTKTVMALLGVTAALALTACTEDSKANTKATEARNDKVNSVVLCGETNASLECKNLQKRYSRYTSPSKISYIYLLADTGGIYSYFVVKGKVSSNLSQMGPTDQLVDACARAGEDCPQSVEAPGDDGSFGPNEDGIFFFTADDVLVTWNGRYLLTDAPLKVNAQNFVLTYQEGSKPTS